MSGNQHWKGRIPVPDGKIYPMDHMSIFRSVNQNQIAIDVIEYLVLFVPTQQFTPLIFVNRTNSRKG